MDEENIKGIANKNEQHKGEARYSKNLWQRRYYCI